MWKRTTALTSMPRSGQAVISSTTTPTTSVVSTGQIRPGATLLCRWAPVEAWHPHMSTHDSTDATYGVTDEERLRLLREERLELKREEIEVRRRQAEAVERLCDVLERCEEATAR